MKKRVNKTSSAPEGYQRVESGDFAQSHDFKKYAVLEGEVLALKTIEQGKGKDRRDVRIAVVHRGDVPVTLWESAALQGLFDTVKVGDRVWVKFTGPIKIRGRKQPMKGFDSAIQPGAKRAKRTKAASGAA